MAPATSTCQSSRLAMGGRVILMRPCILTAFEIFYAKQAWGMKTISSLLAISDGAGTALRYYPGAGGSTRWRGCHSALLHQRLSSIFPPGNLHMPQSRASQSDSVARLQGGPGVQQVRPQQRQGDRQSRICGVHECGEYSSPHAEHKITAAKSLSKTGGGRQSKRIEKTLPPPSTAVATEKRRRDEAELAGAPTA